MKFTLMGKPQSKDRPRFFSVGKGVRSFDPKKAVKKSVQFQLQDIYAKLIEHENREISIEASSIACSDFFHVSMTFFLDVPESDTKARRNAKLTGSSRCTVKPDLDNLEKFYLDCFSGIFFSDDKCVVSLRSEKFYSDNPRVEIEITGGKNAI